MCYVIPSSCKMDVEAPVASVWRALTGNQHPADPAP